MLHSGVQLAQAYIGSCWFLCPTRAPRGRCTQPLGEEERAGAGVRLLGLFPPARGKHRSGSEPCSRLWGVSLGRDRTGKYGVGWLFGGLGCAAKVWVYQVGFCSA